MNFAGRAFATGPALKAVTQGDWNSDGKLDLAVVNSGGKDVNLLFGDGLGGFSPPISLPVGAGAATVAASDLNGDGKLDLVVGLSTEPAVVSLLGGGTGSFLPPRKSKAALASRLMVAVSRQDFAIRLCGCLIQAIAQIIGTVVSFSHA